MIAACNWITFVYNFNFLSNLSIVIVGQVFLFWSSPGSLPAVREGGPIGGMARVTVYTSSRIVKLNSYHNRLYQLTISFPTKSYIFDEKPQALKLPTFLLPAFKPRSGKIDQGRQTHSLNRYQNFQTDYSKVKPIQTEPIRTSTDYELLVKLIADW